jgi:hypothetical protein
VFVSLIRLRIALLSRYHGPENYGVKKPYNRISGGRLSFAVYGEDTATRGSTKGGSSRRLGLARTGRLHNPPCGLAPMCRAASRLPTNAMTTNCQTATLIDPSLTFSSPVLSLHSSHRSTSAYHNVTALCMYIKVRASWAASAFSVQDDISSAQCSVKHFGTITVVHLHNAREQMCWSNVPVEEFEQWPLNVSTSWFWLDAVGRVVGPAEDSDNARPKFVQ